MWTLRELGTLGKKTRENHRSEAAMDMDMDTSVYLNCYLSMGYGLCNSVWWVMFSAKWTVNWWKFIRLFAYNIIEANSSVFGYVLVAQRHCKKETQIESELWGIFLCVCVRDEKKNEPIIRHLNVLVSMVYCSNPKMSCITNRSTNVRQISSDAKIK